MKQKFFFSGYFEKNENVNCKAHPSTGRAFEDCSTIDDEKFMEIALKEAEKAAQEGEVPVGVVIVKSGRIVAQNHNRVEQYKDATAHAEMLAIHDALEKVGGWRLTDCEMYVTLEPCAMCAGAIVHTRIKRLIIGTLDKKTGACGSVIDITSNSAFNHQPQVDKGVLSDECSTILKNFFSKLRIRKNRNFTEKDGKL